MFGLLIVVLITYICNAPVFADEVSKPGVYIVQDVLTSDGELCVANEVTEGVYFFSKRCGEQIFKASSMTVNLTDIDGSLYEAGFRTSLVNAGRVYIFDTRPRKRRPDVKALMKPARNTTTIWYPDLSRQEIVSSDKKLENLGKGQFNITQPVALNASGIIAYKGDSPFCMVEGSGGRCLALKDIFLDWARRFSCGASSRASANLSFYCPQESFYCRHHCEDKQECRLTYGPYSEPNTVMCQSGADCHFNHHLDHIKGHCSAGACMFMTNLWNKKCDHGCSYDTHTLKTFEGDYSDQKQFSCSQPAVLDGVMKIIIGGVSALTLTVVGTFVIAVRMHYRNQQKSKAFYNNYRNF